VVIGGIELAGKIKKSQFKTGKLGGRTARDAGNLLGCAGCLIGTARNRTGEVTKIVPALNLHQSHC